MKQWLSKLTTNEYSLFIAFCALVVSILALSIQAHESYVHQSELDTAKSALTTQGEELEAQRNALAVQQKQLENAERYFHAEGPVLTANLGFWRDAEQGDREDGKPHLLAQKNDLGSGGGRSEDVVLHKSDFEEQPRFYLELTLTNVGRNPGVISRLQGISNLRIDADCPADSGQRRSRMTCGGEDYNFSNSEGVMCLESDGSESACSFPLSIPEGDSRKLRYDITGTLSQPNFVCNEPGMMSLTVPDADTGGGELFIGMDVTNNRYCPAGPSVLLPAPTSPAG